MTNERLQRRSKTQAEHLNQWEEMLAAVTALSEAGEVPPPVQTAADHLRPLLENARVAIIKQDEAEGERLIATKRLSGALNRGRKGASLLRLALKNYYGYDAPELAKFGVKPSRFRTRSSKPPQQPTEPEPEPTAPPSPAPQEETAA